MTGDERDRPAPALFGALLLMLGEIAWLLLNFQGPAGPRFAATLPPLAGAGLLGWHLAGTVRAGNRRAGPAPTRGDPTTAPDDAVGEVPDVVAVSAPDAYDRPSGCTPSGTGWPRASTSGVPRRSRP